MRLSPVRSPPLEAEHPDRQQTTRIALPDPSIRALEPFITHSVHVTGASPPRHDAPRRDPSPEADYSSESPLTPGVPTMSNTRNQLAVSTIEDVLALVRERMPPERADPIAQFIRAYYRGMPEEDLTAMTAPDLYGAALTHWNLATQRKTGCPKIRVYNPQPEQHGWQSSHTIVDVVTDDAPFLVDSLSMALNTRGLPRHLVLHPILFVQRDEESRLLGITDTREAGVTAEAWMHFEVTRQTDRASLDETRENLSSVLHDVNTAVGDWNQMKDQLRGIINGLRTSPPSLPSPEIDNGIAFLEWLDDDHFTFLGYREYQLLLEDEIEKLRSVADSGLGILRNPGKSTLSASFAKLSPQRRKLAHKQELLVIAKANSRSTIHRPGYLDSISLKVFDASGRVVGEQRFLGLYTSGAYTRSVQKIPILKGKVARVLETAPYPEGGHAAKALLHILETFPRDELFHIEDDVLFETATAILNIQDRQRIRLFVHRERYGRYYSCLVFFPRDRYNTKARNATQKILEETFKSVRTDFSVQLSESALARLHFILRVPPGTEVEYHVETLEEQLQSATRAWSDDIAETIIGHFGEEVGTGLVRRYSNAFSAAYQEGYSPRVAVRDIEKIEALSDREFGLAMTLYRPLEAPPDSIKFKLFHAGGPVSLSDALPMLENMGLRVGEERPSLVDRRGEPPIWIHDFGMTHREGPDLDIDDVQSLFQETFERIWSGAVHNDGFNRLVLRARLSWQEIVILRAYAKYLRQISITFSLNYMQKTLVEHPAIARGLIELFHARFHPKEHDETRARALVEQTEAALDEVQALDQDRILRSFLGVIQATVRTNYYQHGADARPKPYLSFKLDPSRIPELPEPRPHFEIFVYSPRVEGVHLRGGLVARGGLRWSDRREDFRTEILGLMKAQMVKNAVIVPVGSKGGFVPMKLPTGGNRDEIFAEAKECYRTFIRGLLDVTDNLVGGQVQPPERVIRHDGDDPYLVVAADKGTATFSDIANEIAVEYGFWLSDAFASGGSAGYDHKAMGITARGAWESVKRHFRQIGVDVQTTPFTVVGIGDMSGDVFGNGMLLSPKIHLVGAFNHRHVFLDPHPDPETGFAERKRLFEMSRSSWADYDSSMLSEGGGIYERSAKSIALSPQIRDVLGVPEQRMTPNEVIQALLKAPVDLLWNGGIGTYVKAHDEHNMEVGDRANDNVRIDASELRCKVVGEGGNLGLTQRARVQYAQKGGRIHTDAIDNVGGVDCSDHEVNIKILLNDVTAADDLTQKHRNALLAEMTDEVAELVLRNNYLQTQALSVAAFQTASMLDVQGRLIEMLENERALARELEFLPDKVEIEDRKKAGVGLTLPELSVLMGYVKLAIYRDLLASDLPESAYVRNELIQYFPTALRERYADLIPRHQLAREIISTVVTNEVVNRAGATFVFRLAEETGGSVADISRAYMVAREVFDQRGFWAEIERLDLRVSAELQTAMLLDGRKLVERGARWFLRNRPQPLNINETVEYFAAGVTSLRATLTQHLPAVAGTAIQRKVEELGAQGVPPELAARVACSTELLSTLDIVQVANDRGAATHEVATIYYTLGSELDLRWVRDQINALPRKNRWQALGRDALRDDLYSQQRAMTSQVLQVETESEAPADRIAAWMSANAAPATRCHRLLEDLKSKDHVDFTMLSVALREIRGMRHLAVDPEPEVTTNGDPQRAVGRAPVGQDPTNGPTPHAST